MLRVLADWRETDRMLSGRAELATLPALQDMREQLARLVTRGFLGEAGADRLRRFPTYLLAIRRRREQLDDKVARDRQLMDQVDRLEEAFLHQVAALPGGPSAGRHAAPRALDARGVPRLPVRPAARHRRTRSATSASGSCSRSCSWVATVDR